MDPWIIYWEFQKGSKSVQLFKEIKELISEVSRLDHAITQESNARKNIENKYAYLLEQWTFRFYVNGVDKIVQ